MRNHWFFLAVVVLITVAFVASFFLISLKADDNSTYTYHSTSIPLFIVYAFFAAGFLGLSIAYLVAGGREGRRVKYVAASGFFALFLVSAGALVTQILLARKFDVLSQRIAYLEAFLPVTVGFLLAGVTVFAGIVADWCAYGEPKGGYADSFAKGRKKIKN